MKQLLLLPLAFYSFQALATNGVNLTSSSVIGLGVAGNGISHYYSTSDALLKNPATLTGLQPTTFEAGFITILTDVKTRDRVQDPSYKSSSVEQIPIPTLAFGKNFGDYSLAAGLVPVAGLSSNFKKATTVFELAPNLSVVNLPVGFAKRFERLSVGAGLAGAIGSASINSSKVTFTRSQSNRNPNHQLSWNANAGLIYDVTPKLQYGLSYRSPTYFKFKRQTDLESYVGVNGTGLDDLSVEIPAEVGTGFTYENDLGIFSLEGKHIFWEEARGFKDYGWKNQDVLSVSWLKAWEKVKWSLGYAYSTQVFSSKSNEDGQAARRIDGVSLTQQNVSYFNVVGYPAILKQHYSLGFHYKLNSTYTLNSSYMYCPPETISRSGTGNFGPYDYSTKISLSFINIGLTANW